MANLSFARIMFGSARELRGEQQSIPHAPLTSVTAEKRSESSAATLELPAAVGAAAATSGYWKMTRGMRPRAIR